MEHLSYDAWPSSPPQRLPEMTPDIPFRFTSPRVGRAPNMTQDGSVFPG